MVGLVFDLARPDTFEKVDDYFNEIREMAGNIPIILVGNKSDLKDSVGEMVTREKIIQKVNQFNLFEYVETSALENSNVDQLFNRLSVCSLLELKPRLGEVASNEHFRFKVLLAGAAAVGKSSLIKTFVKKEFSHDYKITVGLDFMTRDFLIAEEDLPDEVHDIIEGAVEKSLTLKKKPVPKAVMEEKIPIKEDEVVIDQKVLTNNYIYIALGIIFGVLGATIFIHLFLGL